MFSQIKNNLVVASTFFYAIFFFYILFFDFDTAEDINDLSLIVAPIFFLILGFHHYAKPRGVKKISILTFILLVSGLVYAVIPVSVLIEKTRSSSIYDYLFILIGLFQILLAYWCYENSSGVKSKELDMKKVYLLYKEMASGKLSNYQNNSYGKMISDAAMQALGENQLNRISAEIILNIKLEEELGDHKKILNLIMDILSKAYIELDLDSKYMLVPLFVNKKNSNSSYYFFKPEIQKWVYNSYEVLLKKDNLTFENMLKEYHNQTPLSKKYPYIIEGLLEYIKQDKNIKE